MKNTPHIDDKVYKTGYWWFVMAVTGGLSLTFNLWMAIDPPPGVSAGQAATNLLLGVISHASPVLLSAMISHGFKTPLLGEWERRIIIGLFLVFMLMSISTQASLLEKGAHLHWVWAWAMPVAIDTIALLALRAILNAHRLNREAAKQRDIARDMAVLADKIRPGIERDIRAQFEARLPAIREDNTMAVWRDIWVAFGGDIPAAIEGDTARNLAVLVERVQEDILRRKDAEFAARDRALAKRWEVERVDLEDRVRAEEREAAMQRWEEQEKTLASQIEFRLRKELRSASGTGGRGGDRRAIPSAGSDKPKLATEKKKEIVRQAILDGDTLTRKELAEILGTSIKTVGRYRKDVRAEMGLAPEDDTDLYDGADTDEDDGAAHGGVGLRAV